MEHFFVNAHPGFAFIAATISVRESHLHPGARVRKELMTKMENKIRVKRRTNPIPNEPGVARSDESTTEGRIQVARPRRRFEEGDIRGDDMPI